MLSLSALCHACHERGGRLSFCDTNITVTITPQEEKQSAANAERLIVMASASDYSSDSEDDTPIAKKKKSTGAKTDNDDFAFKNVLRPPRSTTYTAQALYGTSNG